LAVVAHCSAGPKEDIIKENDKNFLGFLAHNKEDYINNLDYLIKNSDKDSFG
jgi:hypothetical protein